MSLPDALVELVQRELAARANPDNAGPMAAYMKTEMPFYGVKKPERRPVDRMAKALRPASAEEYAAGVQALWQLPHREEKYIAIAWARAHRRYRTLAALPMYLTMVREGAWWDLVDEIAAHLVGEVWLAHRAEVEPLADEWIVDEDMWIRRTAIIGQLRHGERANASQLFAYCAARAHETEFFIRKAIGWSLRQHAKVDPDAVRAFVEAQGDRLSGLSRREALKHL